MTVSRSVQNTPPHTRATIPSTTRTNPTIRLAVMNPPALLPRPVAFEQRLCHYGCEAHVRVLRAHSVLWAASYSNTTPESPPEVTMAVTVTRNVGTLLLAIWLIVSGLAGLISLPLPPLVMPVLALGAGIAILLGR